MSIRAIVIYLFRQPGCPHCRQATEEVKKFQAQRPSSVVVELDESVREHSINGRSARVTPTYIVKLGNDVISRHEGVLKHQQLIRMFDELQGGE